MELKNKDNIVFAGDSVTDADKTATADGLGSGFVRIIRNALIAFCPDKEFRIINAGVSGNKSADLLGRWEKDIQAFAPDVVICMIGINDVWRHFDYLEPSDQFVSKEDYKRNLELICEKSKNVDRFMFMVPYYMEANSADEMRVLTEDYANTLKEVAKNTIVRSWIYKRHSTSI